MHQVTQSEKEKYLLDLSEEDFREKVVRRLFKRLGYTDGRDLCGPEEQGKDAVFFEEDRMGVRSLIVVQTKKGAINLSANASKNLQDIRAQLRTAIESPFNCVISKAPMYAQKAYLVASGRINQAAREWITNNISNDPRVQYLDRDDIILRIDRHCPEIWLDITADVYPYFHALSKLVDDQSLLGPTSASVAGVKSFYAASDRAFVDLRLIKSVSKSRVISGRRTESFQLEEQGVATLVKLRGARVLLLGDAGSGKSTILLRAAYLMARQSAGGLHDYRVPVIVRASDIAGRKQSSIFDIMADSVDQLVGFRIGAFGQDDLDRGQVILMVDGLDEIAGAADRDEVVQRINEFFARHPRCSVILTTRPYNSIEAIEGVRGFTRCRISPLSLKTAERMLASYQRGTVSIKQSNELMRRIQNIHGLELNPLLVTVFALTTQHDRKDIPANITELFSKFTELMLGRWDETKGLSLQFQARVKEHVTSQFAYRLHTERRTQFSRLEFNVFASSLLVEMNHESAAEQIIEEIVERSGLFRNASGLLEFRHHLIQEYFAGKGIPSVDHIKVLALSEWWRNPVVFFFGTRPHDVQSLLDVATSVGANAGEACITIGLALQTCYLSKLEDKIDVWKWVIETLACVTEQVLANKDEEKFPILYFLTHYLVSRDAVALSGIEKAETFALQWATEGQHFATDPELRKFWAYVGLLEIGELKTLRDRLKLSPIENEHLNLALTFGCRLVEVVRSIDDGEKNAAAAIRCDLESKVAVIHGKFAKEYRGQLLEYRRGAIVALDQEEEFKGHPALVGSHQDDLEADPDYEDGVGEP